MDTDYSPLSSSCVKNLVDKIFDKRKMAALEVERVTKEAFAQDRRDEIMKIICYFSSDFLSSSNPQNRRGGLLGLTSVAIGLNQHACLYYSHIILPIIQSLHDNDYNVRFYACEALYNVMKITRAETVTFLSEIFDAISRCVSDPETSVRQAALQCDRLLKEIVLEPDAVNFSDIVTLLRERIYTNNPYARQFIVSWASTLYSVPGLKISTYLPYLLDGLLRILGDCNPDIRRQCELLLADLLNEIKRDPSEVAFDTMINNLIVHCRLSATACALAEIPARPGSPRASQSANTSTQAILMDITSQSASLSQNSSIAPDSWTTQGGTSSCPPEQLQQRTALTWIRTFVELDPQHLLPFASGIIGAVLPCFLLCGVAESSRDRRVALETAVSINEMLLKAVSLSQSPLPSASSASPKISDHKTLHNNHHPAGDQKLTCHSNNSLSELENPIKAEHLENQHTAPQKETNPNPNTVHSICTDAILDVTYQLLDHSSLLTRLAALRWIGILAKVRPDEVFSHVRRLLPLMLKLLADPAEEMVHSAIWLVGRLCRHPGSSTQSNTDDSNVVTVPVELLNALSSSVAKFSPHDTDPGTPSCESVSSNILCLRFLLDLIELFDKDQELLSKRGDVIITDLCHVLGADCVYQIISTIISCSPPLNSAFVLVRALNRILLTQPTLHEFRNSLRSIRTNTECQLFEQLYRAWSYNPVALLSLCLLTQNYGHCSRLIKSFGDIAITVDILMDMDQLIQMIESPIFANMPFVALRMHMLDRRFSTDLRETLYCLLMCLPQTEAFQTLWRRLQCLPPVDYISDSHVVTRRSQPDTNLIKTNVDFDKLFNHFHSIQEQIHESQINNATVNSSDNQPSGRTVRRGSNEKTNQDIREQCSVRRPKNVGFGSATDYLVESFSTLGINIVYTIPEMEHN